MKKKLRYLIWRHYFKEVFFIGWSKAGYPKVWITGIVFGLLLIPFHYGELPMIWPYPWLWSVFALFVIQLWLTHGLHGVGYPSLFPYSVEELIEYNDL